MPSKSTLERLTLRIDPKLKKNLELEASHRERSVSYLVVKAIEAMLREQAALSVAVAKADRGGLIPQEEIDAWVSSWGRESELPPPEPDVDGA